MYSYPDIDWDGLRKYRTERVAQVMKDANVDALVLMGHDNIRYATDFGVFLICESYDWFAAIVTQEGEAFLYIPYVDRVVDRPMPDLPWIKEFVPTPSWVVQHHPGPRSGSTSFPVSCAASVHGE